MKFFVVREVEANSAAEANTKTDGRIVSTVLRSTSDSKLQLEPQPLSTKKWPLWAKALKQFATPEDKGIGDVVARIIGEENSAAFSAWHLATFGKPCNCKGRQARWNKLYPLP